MSDRAPVTVSASKYAVYLSLEGELLDLKYRVMLRQESQIGPLLWLAGPETFVRCSPRKRSPASDQRQRTSAGPQKSLGGLARLLRAVGLGGEVEGAGGVEGRVGVPGRLPVE